MRRLSRDLLLDILDALADVSESEVALLSGLSLTDADDRHRARNYSALAQ